MRRRGAHTSSRNLKFKSKGCGLVNKLINKLPVEIHIPSYNYCGPGTKLSKRLRRGDKGINPLDEACKEHDIAYSKSFDLKNRNEADQLLASKAFQRFKSRDATLGERFTSLGVAGIMKAKSKLGLGLRKNGKGMKSRKTKKSRRKIKGISFQSAVHRAKKGIIGKKYKNINSIAKDALAFIKRGGVKIKQPTKRIIPLPKFGGILPLIPLFAGLSALGALSGGAAGIASAVNAAKNAKNKLDEQKRHNKVMESLSIGKGLFLRPYKQGCGLYLKSNSKNC